MKIPLSQHLQTLANREELVGLKVYNYLFERSFYILRTKYNKITVSVKKLDFANSINGDISEFSIDLSEQEK